MSDIRTGTPVMRHDNYPVWIHIDEEGFLFFSRPWIANNGANWHVQYWLDSRGGHWA